MKVKKTLAFFICLLIFPLLVVIPNILQNGISFTDETGGFSASNFKIDAIESLIARMLLDQGVSAKPSKVQLGSNGWLFLGDKYRRVYSRSIGKDKRSRDLSFEVKKSIAEWAVLYESMGIKGPFIMIAPNKHSVYWEHLDEELDLAPLTSTDNLMAVLADNPKVVDLRNHFRTLKKSGSYQTYYKTDTHWNSFGAGEAYKYISEQWGGATAFRTLD